MAPLIGISILSWGIAQQSVVSPASKVATNGDRVRDHGDPLVTGGPLANNSFSWQ